MEILSSVKVVLLVCSNLEFARKCAAENEKFENEDFMDESSIWLGIAE